MKLIIFDWDDVLVMGSREAYFQCYRKGIAGVGVKLDPKEERRRIFHQWSTPHRIKFRYILQENPELADRAADIYEKNIFGDILINALSRLPGTRRLLQRLDKYTLCVATGTHHNVLKKVLLNFGFPDVFAKITSTSEIDPQKVKPHPYMITSLMEEFNVKPSETIMVGDGEADVKMAFAAGVIPVVVLTGLLTKNKAKEMNVKYIIEDVTKLEKVLDQLKAP